VRPRLAQPELCGQDRQAVAGGARQQDARDMQGVDHLRLARPEAGGDQEVDVEAGSVADRLPAAQEIGQLLDRRLG